MTPTVFLESLAWQLTLSGVPHTRQDLEAFVADVWTQADVERPDFTRWAREFQERHAGVAVIRQ